MILRFPCMRQRVIYASRGTMRNFVMNRISGLKLPVFHLAFNTPFSDVSMHSGFLLIGQKTIG